jgi:spore coat-associated protein N
MRTLATLVTSLAMALAAIGLAVAAPGRGHDPASASLSAASGAVGISNSLAGAAVLSAGDLRPGDSVEGTVTIGNDGDVAGRFVLAAPDVVDTPGPGGGALSGRVVLTVTDLTGGTQLFSGHPADLAESDVGTLEPGDEHEFRFTLTWPSAPAGDNLYQGSALSLGFEWRAGAAGGSVPTPKPKPKPVKPKPKPAPTPTTPAPVPPPVSIADQLGLPAAKSCVKGRRLKLKLKAPAGTRIVSATVKVNGRTKARLKGAKTRKPVNLKKLRKTTRLKLTVRLSNGKTYKVSRTYRACR